MTPSTAPPTEPGFYRWHDGKGAVVEYVLYQPSSDRVRMFAFNPIKRSGEYADKFPEGYWERIDRGEPYLAPQPPKVELWEGELARGVASGGPMPACWLFLCDKCYVAVAKDDGRLIGNGESNAGPLLSQRYTNLRKVGEYALKEVT